MGQVPSSLVAAQVALALVLASGAAQAQPYGCAGDAPPSEQLALSGLLGGQVAPYLGADAALRQGDAAERRGFQFSTVRLGLCGRYQTGKGPLFYQVVYEPWDVVERAHADSRSWGRFAVAEVGFAPWRWLAISLGVRKVAFSFGHDEPLGAQSLAIRPYVTTSVAPDRRLGLTLDADFGTARIIVGVYEGARDLTPTEVGGLVLAVRLVAEPIGPVGRSLSTVADEPGWRRRPRFGVNASIDYEYTPNWSGYAIGADVPFKWGPLAVAVEYLYAVSTPEEGPSLQPTPLLNRQGLWAGFALMLLRPCLELVGRYDWFDVSNEPRQRFSAATVGLNSYFFGTRLRAQAAYSHQFHNAGAYDDDVLLLTLTLAGSVKAK